MHNANRQMIEVIDPALLATIVQESVGKRFPRQEDAAAKLRISQGHYSRLRRGRGGRGIRRPLLIALRRYLTPEQEMDLQRAILAPEAHALRDTYGDWLGDNLELVDLGHIGDSALASSLEITERAYGEGGARRRAERRFRRLLLYRDMLASLLGDRIYGPSLQGFIEDQEGAGYAGEVPGHHHPRLELALVRIVTPLLGFIESENVERSLIDLHISGDLRRYLEAAIKREELLMRRPPDLPRIQAAASEHALVGS